MSLVTFVALIGFACARVHGGVALNDNRGWTSTPYVEVKREYNVCRKSSNPFKAGGLLGVFSGIRLDECDIEKHYILGISLRNCFSLNDLVGIP